jgi:hypothetical protein
LKLIAGVGYVGCAKYTRIGGKEGNIGVVIKEIRFATGYSHWI